MRLAPAVRLVSCLILFAACRRADAPVPTKGEPAETRAASELVSDARSLLADHRRMLVLLAGEPAADDRALLVARRLSHQVNERAQAVSERVDAAPALAAPLLDWLERAPELRDADKLPFRDVLAALPTSSRVTEDLVALDRIQARYEDELRGVLERIGTRAFVERRESWDSYLAALRAIYDAKAIDALLREYDDEVAALSEGTRGAPPWRDDEQHITGRRLPAKVVALTFDDGPGRTTPAVLDVLAREGVPGTFFQVGRNVARTPREALRVKEAGHVLANHSYTHAFLPKLVEPALGKQLADTNAAIHVAGAGDPTLFRPPYGARNERVIAAAASAGMKIVLWNVDSLDWSDPVPSSIAARVVAQVEKEGRGIVLFHDIHQRTVEALPLAIAELRKRGYRFAGWDGKGFSLPASARGASAPAAGAAVSGDFYRASWAVVIGIDAYQKWPKLGHAVADARAVRDKLLDLGWKAENVITLLDGDATRAGILSALGDRLADGQRVQREDRVLVFFAGHGLTRPLPSGRNLGYLVPVDADTKNPQAEAISMTNLQDVSEAIPAKHVFFVMDACYGGLALTRAATAAPQGDRRKYFQEITRRGARQVLTAGGADEPVADNGPGGHSIFTWMFLQGLGGKADLDGDGAVTATELAAHVGPSVSSLSRQTPAFGHLVGSEGGEFLFTIKKEPDFLSEDVESLEAEAARLNTALAGVQRALASKRGKESGQPVAAAPSVVDGGADARAVAGVARSAGPLDQGRQKLAEGIALHKAMRYAEAAAAFEDAFRFLPTSALAANNAGFDHYKLGAYAAAATWFEKTIAVDPQRAIAHANLGDAYLKLGRTDEARKAYERYLELAPTSKLAPTLRKRLESPTLAARGDGGT